jgi:hypothetical protein
LYGDGMMVDAYVGVNLDDGPSSRHWLTYLVVPQLISRPDGIKVTSMAATAPRLITSGRHISVAAAKYLDHGPGQSVKLSAGDRPVEIAFDDGAHRRRRRYGKHRLYRRLAQAPRRF